MFEQLAAQLSDKRIRRQAKASLCERSAYRRAKLPEGADQKAMLPRKTPAKLKLFDSCSSPSGLLERLVSSLREFQILIYLDRISLNQALLVLVLL